MTRNIDDIKAVSGRLATVTAVETAKAQIEIEHQRGGRHRLDLAERDHQHFIYGYPVTAQRAQGATDYPIINAPSWRLNTVNEASIYAELSSENLRKTRGQNRQAKPIGHVYR